MRTQFWFREVTYLVGKNIPYTSSIKKSVFSQKWYMCCNYIEEIEVMITE